VLCRILHADFREFILRNCPKSLGGAHCVAVRETETVLFGPCRAPYTAKYGVGALLVTLFGQFLLGRSVNRG
jgi:hypothetical protein